MRTRGISQCDSSLQFWPRAPRSSALPAYSWGEFLLTHFEDEQIQSEAIDLRESGSELGVLLAELYPQMSFTQQAHLFDNLLANKDSLGWNPKTFFSFWGLNDSPNTVTVAEKVLHTSKEFRQWLHDKKIQPKDLAPLRTDFDIKQATSAFDFIATTQATKSQGVQALELIVEVVLINGQLPKELLDFKTTEFAPWLEALKQARLPMASEIKNQKEALLRKFSNPKHIEYNWRRRGDTLGLEVKFFAQNKEDLESKLQSLQKWQDQQGCKLWS